MHTKPILLAMALATAIPASTLAQTATGSAACAALTQAAANAAATRIAADDQDIKPPERIKSLTCLDNFFKGIGLNVVVNLLDPTTLLQSIEGQLCQLVTQKWQSLLGKPQCGITLTGFDIGFFGGLGNGGLGSGISCPKLNFGGGGPQIGTIGVGANHNGGLYINGAGTAPTGYTLPQQNGIW